MNRYQARKSGHWPTQTIPLEPMEESITYELMGVISKFKFHAQWMLVIKAKGFSIFNNDDKRYGLQRRFLVNKKSIFKELSIQWGKILVVQYKYNSKEDRCLSNIACPKEFKHNSTAHSFEPKSNTIFYMTIYMRI